MNDPFIKVFSSTETMAGYFADMLKNAVNSTPANGFVSLALSGGSTPRGVYSYLASMEEGQVDWNRVRVFWGDERCVGPASEESNYKMVRDTLLRRVDIPESNIFRIRGEEDPLKEASRYSGVVSREVPEENNLPRFDIVMLGLGEDGHTLSIFPDSSKLYNSERLFEAAVNPYSGQQRITGTGRLTEGAKMAVFLVTGGSKSEMAAKIIRRVGDWQKFPASLVSPINGRVIWLLDSEAARKLPQ